MSTTATRNPNHWSFQELEAMTPEEFDRLVKDTRDYVGELRRSLAKTKAAGRYGANVAGLEAQLENTLDDECRNLNAMALVFEHRNGRGMV